MPTPTPAPSPTPTPTPSPKHSLSPTTTLTGTRNLILTIILLELLIRKIWFLKITVDKKEFQQKELLYE